MRYHYDVWTEVMRNSAGANASRINKITSFMLQTCTKPFAVATSIYVSLPLLCAGSGESLSRPLKQKMLRL